MERFMSSIQNIPLIDIRTIAPAERHPRIFGTLTALAPGGLMQAITIRARSTTRSKPATRTSSNGQYLEQGPDVWRVEIKRYESSGCDCACGH
jgi:uncharacterized protein (DUF2249 family)